MLPIRKSDGKLVGSAAYIKPDHMGRYELWPVFLEKCYAYHKRSFDILESDRCVDKILRDILPAHNRIHLSCERIDTPVNKAMKQYHDWILSLNGAKFILIVPYF